MEVTDVAAEKIRGYVNREEADRESDPESTSLELICDNWLRDRRTNRGVEARRSIGDQIGEVQESRKESSREAKKTNGSGIVATGKHREEKGQNGEDQFDEEQKNIEAAGETQRAVLACIGDVVEDDLAEEEGGAGGEEPDNGSDFKILKARFHQFQMFKKIVLAFGTANMGKVEKAKQRVLYNDSSLPKPRDLETLLHALNGEAEKIEERELLTSILGLLFKRSLKWKVAQKILLVLFRVLSSEEWPLARSNICEELRIGSNIDLQGQAKSSMGLALPFTKSAFKLLCLFSACVQALPRVSRLKRPATSSKKPGGPARSPQPKMVGKRGGHSLMKSQLETAGQLVRFLQLFNQIALTSLPKFLSLKKSLPIMRALFIELFQPLEQVSKTLDQLLSVLSSEAQGHSPFAKDVLVLLQRFDAEYKLLFKCFMDHSQFAGECNVSLPIFNNAIFSNLFKLQCAFTAYPRIATPIEIDLDTHEEGTFSEGEDESPRCNMGRMSVSPPQRYLKEETKMIRPHTSTGMKKEELKKGLDPFCELSGIEVADLKAPPSAFMPLTVHRSLSRRSLPKRQDESESVSIMTRETWQRGGADSAIVDEEDEPQSQDFLFQTRSKLGEGQANETINSSKGFLDDPRVRKEEGRRSLLDGERY